MHISNEVLAALISGGFGITVALIQRVGFRVRRTSDKIDGLRNGRRDQAERVIEELRREREELEIQGMRPQRRVDSMVEEHRDHL